MENQYKNTSNEAYHNDLEESDLPPISFTQPNSQKECFVYKYSQNQNVTRMNAFTVQQSPQPVEKVVECSDETMLEQKQENQKVERSYSENSMECEVEKKQKNVNGDVKQNTNIINAKEKVVKQTHSVENVRQIKTKQNDVKNVQMKTNVNQMQNVINKQMQNANQINQTNQISQVSQMNQVSHQTKQKSKEKVNQSMYNVLPNAIPNAMQQTQKEQIATNKLKLTTPQATQKGTAVNVNSPNAKNTKEKKPTKLRFQTCDKKQRPLIPIKSTKPAADPNMTKRREMIRGLRDLQRKCLFTQTKVISSQKTEMNATTFLRDMNEYCYRNDFFRCGMNEKREIIVSCEMFGERTINIVFDMNEKNYENWSFPKPRLSDGKEICDKNMMDKMKKQPSIEILMNELFRIITLCCAKY